MKCFGPEISSKNSGRDYNAHFQSQRNYNANEKYKSSNDNMKKSSNQIRPAVGMEDDSWRCNYHQIQKILKKNGNKTLKMDSNSELFLFTFYFLELKIGTLTKIWN
jgi:hypothetical protein